LNKTVAAALILCFALSFVAPTIPKAAGATTSYAGNDNAEIATSTSPGYVTAEMYITQNLVFSSGSPNVISLQLNPDEAMSILTQQYAAVFQPSIIGIVYNGDPCIQFTVQIYGFSNWVRTDPGGTTCWPTQQAFSAGAYWQITENMQSGLITSVHFVVNNGHGAQLTDTITPPSGDKWIRSSLCLCGAGGTSAKFTNGGGMFYYWSNVQLNKAGPPIITTTEESSNVDYGCMSGTSMISQTFGLSGPCAQ
jgi:hypothetical protein